MVDELRRANDDRFSHYFDPEHLRGLPGSTSGQFSGVGLSVNEVKRGLRVAQVYRGHARPRRPGSSERRRDRRRRRRVDRGRVLRRADRADQGPARDRGRRSRSSPPTTGEAREIDVERAEVRIPAVRGEIERRRRAQDRLRALATFSEGAHGELRDEIERLYRRGAEGLVLDLRGNGGGLLDEAVLTTSVFVEDGPDRHDRGPHPGDEDYDGGRRRARPAPDWSCWSTATPPRPRRSSTAALQQNDLGDGGRRPGPSARASSRR